MHPLLLVSIVLLCAALDYRSLRIPNGITFTLIITGMVFCLLDGTSCSFSSFLVGMGFVIVLFTLYALELLGAGDCKLFLGMWFWMGYASIAIFGLSVVFALLFAFVETQGYLRLCHRDVQGVLHMPYAVPTACATTLFLLLP